MQESADRSLQHSEAAETNLLDALVKVGPLIQKLVPVDCTFAVAYTKKSLLQL